MTTILLHTVSTFDLFIIIIVFLAIVLGLLAFVTFFVRKTNWYKNSTSENKSTHSILVSCLVIVLGYYVLPSIYQAIIILLGDFSF